MACIEKDFTNETEYQVQYNDPWDFFDVCEGHLAKHLLDTFKDYDKLPKSFVVTKYEASDAA
jgi:hypothetical protein